MEAQLATRNSRTFRQVRKRYRFAACGAVIALALAGGVALGLRPSMEARSPAAADLQVAAQADVLPALRGMPKGDAAYDLPADMPTSFAALRRLEREYAESAATSSRTMPYLADRWFELPSDPRSINALDPAYDWPPAGTPAASPRVADPWYAQAATSAAFPGVADRWFGEPTTVTGPGFPHVADRR